ncbi:MAG: endonuclease/exonuclease/phosphatase family protein [Rhodobacteraceae bacterium]|nr:endonuclease/exonuclease/phosphatase family protein [Paracoccaceae bacterium]
MSSHPARLGLFSALVLLAGTAFADEVDLRVMSFNIWYGGVQVSQPEVIEILKASDADIIGLQEPDGQTAALAAAAGYPYVDLRRHIISRVPLFDPKLGERTDEGQAVYPLAGLDADAPHVWAMVAPGKVVALGNLHLTSDPYGPDLLRDGTPLADVLQGEADSRLAEIDPYAAALEPLVAAGTPVIVTGDFNTPSHLDYTEAAIGLRPAMTAAVPWPVTLRMEAAGFTDTFRAAHPDPVARPGLTYSPGFPWPVMREGESLDRIDYVFAANATVRAAEVWGEPANADVDRAFAPWPSDHRAVIADLSVTPVDAPALLAVEPRLVPEGGTFVVRGFLPGDAVWGVRVVPRGGDPVADTITSVEGLTPTWNRAFRFSTLGLSPGPWDAVLIDETGVEQARTRFSVLARDGKPTLTIATPVARTGDPLTVSWTGAPGFKYDWLGVYAAGDPNLYNYLAFAYTGAVNDGTMTLTPDLYYEELAPGDYELRLMADDHYVTLATAPFTITE